MIYFLRQGTGRFRVGNDVITFGPGQADHEMIRMEGVSYETPQGPLQPDHRGVYITRLHPVSEDAHIRLKQRNRFRVAQQ